MAEGDFPGDDCRAALRGHDRDLYLCALVTAHPAVTALFAFNAEIERARQGVSEAMIGHMRMKWWYDALAGVFSGAPPHHPVAQALAEAVPHGLERPALEGLIEAHAEALGAEADWRVDSLVTRADVAQGPLFRQILDILDARGADADAAATAAARAWGLLQEMRRAAVPPGEVRKIHAAADDFRRQAGPPRGAAAPALLPMVLAETYLRRIAKAGFDLGHPLARRGDPGAMALPRLWWAAKRA